MSQKRIGLIVVVSIGAVFLLLSAFAYWLLSPLFSCGYSAEQEDLARALFDHSLLAEQVDTVRIHDRYNHDVVELSNEEVSTFLSMVSQNRSGFSNGFDNLFSTLQITDTNGTVCDFDFYVQSEYVFLGARCLRYEKGNWSTGAGEVYDWLVSMR